MGMMDGKRALIVGVASKRSIAWGIAEAMHREGATLAFTYQNDRLKELFVQLKQSWDSLDSMVHAVAFAPREQLEGDFLEAVTREGFNTAHEISSYSFAGLAKAARPMLAPGASLMTLTYLGAVRAMPNYNVMGLAKASLEANTRFMANALGPDGIRVNAISAGPIKTLAAAGIGNFKKLLGHVAAASPLRENVTLEQVGNTAAFLYNRASGLC